MSRNYSTLACCSCSSSSLSELSSRIGKAGVRESSPTSQAKPEERRSRGTSVGLVCFPCRVRTWKEAQARLFPDPTYRHTKACLLGLCLLREQQ